MRADVLLVTGLRVSLDHVQLVDDDFLLSGKKTQTVVDAAARIVVDRRLTFNDRYQSNEQKNYRKRMK